MQGSASLGHRGAARMAVGAEPRAERHKSDADSGKKWWRVYVQSDLETRMMVTLRSTDTPAQTRAKIESAHLFHFPSLGRVRVEKMLISAFGHWWVFGTGDYESFSCAESLLKVELTRLQEEARPNTNDDRVQDQPTNNVVDGQQKALEVAVSPSSNLLEKVKDPSSTLTKRQKTPGAAQASNGSENQDVEENLSSRPFLASRAPVVSALIGQIFSQDTVQKNKTEVSENGKLEVKVDKNKRTASAADLQSRSEELKKVRVGGAEEEQQPAGLTQGVKEAESFSDEDSEEERDANLDRVLTQHFPESSSSDRSGGGDKGKEAGAAETNSKEIASESQRMGNSRNDFESDAELDRTEELPGARESRRLNNSKDDSDSDDELDTMEEKNEPDELPGASESQRMSNSKHDIESDDELGPAKEKNEPDEPPGASESQRMSSSENDDNDPTEEKTEPDELPGAVADSVQLKDEAEKLGAGIEDGDSEEQSGEAVQTDGCSELSVHDNLDEETAPLDPKTVSGSSPESSGDTAGCRHDKEAPEPALLDSKIVPESSSESLGGNARCRPLSQRPFSQPTKSFEASESDQEEEKEMSGLARLSHHAVKALEQDSSSSSGSSEQSGQRNGTATITPTRQQDESGLARLSRHAEKVQASFSQTQRKSSVKSASSERSESESSDDDRANQKAQKGDPSFSDKGASPSLVVATGKSNRRGISSSSGASSGSSSSISSEESGGSEWKTPVARSRRTIDSRNQHFVEDKNGLSKLLTRYTLKRRKSPEGRNKDTEEARGAQTPESAVRAGKSSEPQPEQVVEKLKKDEPAPRKSQPTKTIDSQQSARRDRKKGIKGKEKQDGAVKGATAGERQGEEASKEDPGTAGANEEQKSNGIRSKSKNRSPDAEVSKEDPGTAGANEEQRSNETQKKKGSKSKNRSQDAEASKEDPGTAGANEEQKSNEIQKKKGSKSKNTTQDAEASKGDPGTTGANEEQKSNGIQKKEGSKSKNRNQDANKDNIGSKVEQQQSPKRPRKKKITEMAESTENEDSQKNEAAGAEAEPEVAVQRSKRARKEKNTEGARQKLVAPEDGAAQQNGTQKETAEVPEGAVGEAGLQQSPKRSSRKKTVAATSEEEFSRGDDEEQTPKKRRMKKKEEKDGDEGPAPKKQKTASRGAKDPNDERVICPCGRSYVRKTSNYYNHIRSCQTAISAAVNN